MRSTPAVPTHEGRPLPRPDEEVVDQGLAFDIGTLMGRRRMLRTLGLGVAGLGLAACGTAATSANATTSAAATSSAASSSAASSAAASGSEIPDETAGPYPGDGSNGPDVLSESGVVRSDIRSSFGASSGTAEGVPMTLRLTIRDLANGGVPFAGVAVYVWHCNAAGEYSMYSEGVTDQNYLRGVQIADADGVVSYTSVFPACYSGRWPHIHFEVYPDEAAITDATKAIATSQVALPKDVCDAVYATAGYEESPANLAQVTLQSDNVFGDDGGALQLGSVTGDVTQGYAASLNVGVDTTTAPTGGSVPGGGGGGGQGGTPPTGGTGGPGGTPPTGRMGTPPSGAPGAPTTGATTTA
ncbi:protocatechuate 3,4-dioxygenase beta subunit [Nakamurella flavida]|uniref:intradiol ring-cleavage dioxygenase n=1 Tax=Nakamurella flavida TaxID=363630 RepID=UPI0027844C81|nr:intradiol ring-cleavage dioxygenase [Nakamurella flavida]MDP9778534.1 protocatechuate 3,4-dioxygenase beta subunit [Nakamurella flavida]